MLHLVSGISRPRPVPTSKLIEDSNVFTTTTTTSATTTSTSMKTRNVSPDAVSAISQTFSESGSTYKPIISAASFPDEDPVEIEPEKFRMNPDHLSEEPEKLPKLETQIIINNGSDTDATFM